MAKTLNIGKQLVGYESHDRAAPGGTAAPKLPRQKYIFPFSKHKEVLFQIFFAISTANSIINNCQ